MTLPGEDVEDVADDFAVVSPNGGAPVLEQAAPGREGDGGDEAAPDEEVDDQRDERVGGGFAEEEEEEQDEVIDEGEDELWVASQSPLLVPSGSRDRIGPIRG